MTAATLTIADFLLARIGEDEAVAGESFYEGQAWSTEEEAVVSIDQDFEPVLFMDRKRDATHAANWSPARVLAECAAKRAIVELHQSWPVLVETAPSFETVDSTDVMSMTFRMSQQISWKTEQQYRDQFGSEPPTGPILRALASVYADHPDFDPAWS